MSLSAVPAWATEPIPGDSCSSYPENAVMRSGGPELGGAFYFLRCEGDIWVDITEILPADPCETGPVGTVCASDGAVYAGTTVGGARMYVAAADEGGGYRYGGYGTDLNGNNSSVAPELRDDGLANTDWLLANGEGDHDAAQACRDRGADWYLPAIDELGTLYANRAQLSTANLPTSTSWYWSSSESNFSTARIQRFSDGGQNLNGKNLTSLVRCVRR